MQRDGFALAKRRPCSETYYCLDLKYAARRDRWLRCTILPFILLSASSSADACAARRADGALLDRRGIVSTLSAPML